MHIALMHEAKFCNRHLRALSPFTLFISHPQDNINVVSDSLDILFELLVRFGSLVPSEEMVGE